MKRAFDLFKKFLYIVFGSQTGALALVVLFAALMILNLDREIFWKWAALIEAVLLFFVNVNHTSSLELIYMKNKYQKSLNKFRKGHHDR